MYIVMKDDEFFIVDVVNDSDMVELEDIIKSVDKENLKLYFTVYRTVMGIPLNITPKMERMMLRERFGEAMIDNKEFISNIILAQKEFESNKKRVPDVLLWLVDRDAEVTPADGYLQV